VVLEARDRVGGRTTGQRMSDGHDRPFWRDEGLSGHASSPDLPLSFVLHNVPHGSGHGVLVGFAEG